MQGRGYGATRIQRFGHLLLLGMRGQNVCYGCFFPDSYKGGMGWCATALLTFPWALVFGITFPQGPWPFGPRPFRLCLLVAMSWYASASILVELIAMFRHFQSSPGVHLLFPVMLVAHVMMYAGWLSFIPFTRMCIFLRDLERKQAAAWMAEGHDQTGSRHKRVKLVALAAFPLLTGGSGNTLSSMSIEELKSSVAQLPAGELAAFSRWFEGFMADQWDKQIEAGILAGRLDAAGKRAEADYHTGCCTPLLS